MRGMHVFIMCEHASTIHCVELDLVLNEGGKRPIDVPPPPPPLSGRVELTIGYNLSSF